MIKHSYDIVIVGGGLVGTTLAMSLSKTSYRIALIEANIPKNHEQSTKDLRAIALSYESQQIFERLNIWKNIKDKATPIKKIHVSEQNRFGNTVLSSEEIHLDAFGFVIPIQSLYNELQNHLTHIELIRPALVSDVLQKENSWELKVHDQTIHTKLLIAADGERSLIRKTLNIPVEENDHQQVAIVSNCAISKPHEFTAYERFTKKGILAIMPLQNNRAALILATSPDNASTLLECENEIFLKEIQTLFGYRLGKLSDLGKRQSYPLRECHVKKQTLPNLLLLGNAAHTLNPIASQGFNLSLRDVSNLSNLLSKNIPIDDQSIPEIYNRLREKDQQETLNFTHRLIDTFKPQIFPFPFLRSKGLFLFDLYLPAKQELEWRRTSAIRELSDSKE